MRVLAQLCINSVSPGPPLLNWSELNIKQGLSLSANTDRGVGAGRGGDFAKPLSASREKDLAKRYAYDRKHNLCHQI